MLKGLQFKEEIIQNIRMSENYPDVYNERYQKCKLKVHKAYF